MDELFDLQFEEAGERFIYRLTENQAIDVYRNIGDSLASIESTDGFDFTFKEEDSWTGKTRNRIFKIGKAETLTLYRQLGTYLLKHYPGSEPQLHLHVANS